MAGKLYEIAHGVFWMPLRGANVYFVRSEASWALVDAGYPSSSGAIRQAAARLCGATGHPRSILVTHGHPDHIGAATGLAEAWDVPILVSENELPYVTGAALYPEPLVMWLRRVLPRRAMDALTRGSDMGGAVRSFDPKADLPDLPGWTAVETPGHTPGHTAFFRPSDRTLLAGDAVLTMAWASRLGGGGPGWLWDLACGRPRLSGPPSLVTCDWRAAAASVASLAELRPAVLASGHGTPLGGEQAAAELRAFAARASATALD